MMVLIKRYEEGQDYWNPLRSLLEDIGISAIREAPLNLSNIIAIERPKYEYVEVFSPSTQILNILQLIEIDRLYSLGLYMGMMKPREWFKPSLPLAHKLAPYRDRVRCIILDSNGEKYFLYGKTVFEENIEEWKPGLSLIVNEMGEALGWGTGKITNIGGRRRRVVEPIWDMGWYLRRGG